MHKQFCKKFKNGVTKESKPKAKKSINQNIKHVVL